MAIDDEGQAKELASRLAAEMVATLDAGMLAEAKAMGMATSVFAAQIEAYRAQFNSQVTAAIAALELFDVAASKLLLESE